MPGDALRIVIAGGGTGGHLYPGIAVARALVARVADAVVSFAGTAQGLEARMVPREGFALDLIRSAGLKGQSPWALARGVTLLLPSALDGWRVVTRRRPHVVVGLGGYSSGPIVLMAALRGIPTLLMEQNAVPGLANRWLARVVRAAAVTYDTTLPYFGAKGFVSGNPVRPEFFAAGSADGKINRDTPPRAARILIFGGSQGAHAINMAMVAAASDLAVAAIPLEITHQTGVPDLDVVRRAYGRAGVPARVEPFLYEMHREVTAADVLVCRAGATTLAEIAAAGRAAILIPLLTATDDHQCRNAEVLARAGAAEVIDQRDLTGNGLAGRILDLAGDAARRERMAAAVRAMARPDAADRIVDRVMELAAARR
jgi:UDP-N-acetylglucosamine--N-acetylmuramyl-(pentapeptide) pyrophosphoryl-undecaprenol N-acetylglucosamine transferase